MVSSYKWQPLNDERRIITPIVYWNDVAHVKCEYISVHIEEWSWRICKTRAMRASFALNRFAFLKKNWKYLFLHNFGDIWIPRDRVASLYFPVVESQLFLVEKWRRRGSTSVNIVAQFIAKKNMLFFVLWKRWTRRRAKWQCMVKQNLRHLAGTQRVEQILMFVQRCVRDENFKWIFEHWLCCLWRPKPSKSTQSLEFVRIRWKSFGFMTSTELNECQRQNET